MKPWKWPFGRKQKEVVDTRSEVEKAADRAIDEILEDAGFPYSKKAVEEKLEAMKSHEAFPTVERALRAYVEEFGGPNYLSFGFGEIGSGEAPFEVTITRRDGGRTPAEVVDELRRITRSRSVEELIRKVGELYWFFFWALRLRHGDEAAYRAAMKEARRKVQR